MNALSLFSGIGGIDLGLERAGMRVVAQCEIEPFARAVLAKHWPDVRRYEDVRKLDGTEWRGTVDVVAGGFPCQDISTAGKGAGIEKGERSGLWREMRRIIAECRPRWVLAENVPALRTRGADIVLADLESLGYSAWPVVVGAWAVGAPHRRDRVWIIAKLDDTAGDRLQRREVLLPQRGSQQDRADVAGAGECGGLADPASERREPGSGHVGNEGLARSGRADAGGAGREERHAAAESGRAGFRGRRGDAWPAGPEQEQHEWEEPRLADAEELRRSIEGQWRGEEVAGPATDDAGSRPCPERAMGRTVDGLSVGLVQLVARASGRDLSWAASWIKRNRFKIERAINRQSLRGYGNAVVPAVVELIARWIVEQDALGRKH